MTNDEQKKKIVDTMHPILKGTRVSCNEENACEHCLFPCEVDRIADRLADALIAAGYGDVKEAEHRAARAEKALNKFAENVTCEDCPFFSDCSSSEKMKDSVHSNYCYAEYLRQAEKELAEERK